MRPRELCRKHIISKQCSSVHYAVNMNSYAVSCIVYEHELYLCCPVRYAAQYNYDIRFLHPVHCAAYNMKPFCVEEDCANVREINCSAHSDHDAARLLTL